MSEFVSWDDEIANWMLKSSNSMVPVTTNQICAMTLWPTNWGDHKAYSMLFTSQVDPPSKDPQWWDPHGPMDPFSAPMSFPRMRCFGGFNGYKWCFNVVNSRRFQGNKPSNLIQAKFKVIHSSPTVAIFRWALGLLNWLVTGEKHWLNNGL